MLKRFTSFKAAIAAAALAVCASTARAEVTSTRMLEESVRVPGAGAPVVIVKNVFGSIRVSTHDRETVDMTATETVHGDLQADIARARAEVELRTESEEGRVAFRVRRIGDDRDFGNHWDGNHWDGYRIEYAIEVRVPRDAGVELSTVNNGEIVVDGVRGDFVVSNVNGAVRLTGLRGAGRISTVNGPVEASFERAPATATQFKTVNGKIEVTFPPDLAADLDFKTMHGQFYTDFDVQTLARAPETERRRDGDRLVIRTQRASVLRVAGGGPALSFETLNGSVYVRRAGR
jgi:hypothetical protein